MQKLKEEEEKLQQEFLLLTSPATVTSHYGYMGSPGSSAGKESSCNAGDPGSIPGSGRFPGEGIGPVQSLSHVRLFVTPWTVALQPPLSIGIFQARILEWVSCPPPGDLPNPGIFPTRGSNPVSHIAGGSLPTEPPGKPKHTELGSLSLLQRIFLTQESNRGLLHCKRVLY